MQVGTKELKNRLSHYLRRVRAGDLVHVTDRGKVIAELRAVPNGVTDDTACLLDLESEGAVTIGAGRVPDIAPSRVKTRKRASSGCHRRSRMIHYLDTSALVKRYVLEPGASALAIHDRGAALTFWSADRALVDGAIAFGLKAVSATR